MPDEEISRRTEIANSIARSETQVTVMEVGEGPLSIESSIEEDMALGPMLRRLLQIRQEGKYNAIIIGCAGDPGLKSARELLDIPVIGPAESSYHFACMVSERFSILSTRFGGADSGDHTRSRLREMGLEARMASVEFVKIPIAEMWGKNRELVAKQMIQAVESAKKRGAGCVVLGCMSLAFLLLDEEVEQQVGLPIINPLKTAIKTAEIFVDIKAKHSRVTYPAADFDKLNKTVFAK
ncbi:MAG: aspartate/glutamate racemase family protein [Candidatus Hodarchaeota archaeon]